MKTAHAAPKGAADDGDSDAYGAATQVALSAPAQAVLSSQSSGTGNSTAQPPAGGGAAPEATPAVDTASLIETAKRKVIPQVGVAGANAVVDNQGNISRTRLAQLIAAQEKTSGS